jgi:hypothetical protein
VISIMTDSRLTRGVLRVGDGRGFVVDGHDERLIITAARCLPFIPPCHPARYLSEQTYERLLGLLGGEQTVWAECRFVDAIVDIAVLGQPDNQAYSDQADTYEQLVDSMEALPVADAIPEGVETFVYGEYCRHYPVPGHGQARVLSLNGQWLTIDIWRRGGNIGTKHDYEGGMSGSPIVNMTGAAVGVVSVDILSPVIADSLSVRLMRAITNAAQRELEEAS